MSHHTDRRPQSYPHHTTTTWTYTDTPSSNYFARLSEKAAPSGTIHLNSYDSEPSCYYRQAVYDARSPAPGVFKEVRREVVRGPAPTVGVQERVVVGGREPARQPGLAPAKKVVEGKGEERGEVRERGFVWDVTGRGVGAVWKALGGQSRVR